MTDQPQEPPEKKRQQKPKGRGNGEGSVFKRKTGNRNKSWVAQITLSNGKKRTIGYFETEKEAIFAKQQALGKQARGKLTTGPRQSIKQYLEYWIENIQKLSVKLTSYVKGREVVYGHIIPELGHIQLSKLTRQDVQAFYGKLLTKKLGASRINFIHGTLHKALKDAVDAGLISDNVCHGAKVPRIDNPERPALTPEEARRFLEAAKGHRLEALFTLAIATGMRHGELCGLTWKDLYLKEGYLQVRRTRQSVSGYGVVELEPKTKQSKRRISLPTFLVDTLQKHHIKQLEERLEKGTNWDEGDLVFPNTRGRFLYARQLSNAFYKILTQAGLPRMHFHDLRHSAATILLTMGVNPKAVQEILGHSDITITLRIYGHVLPGVHDQAMESMGEVLNQPRDSQGG